MSLSGLAVILFTLPIASALFFVLHFGVDVPWGDQWDILPPLLEKLQENEIDFSDLTIPHNGHRILFPRLLMLGLAYLTHWNARAEMLVILLMLLMILWLLASELRRDLRDSTGWWPLVPLPFLLFNLKQWETLLFGVQIAYILPILMAIAALRLLKSLDEGPGWVWMILAVVCALVASFSLLAGLFVWPAGLVVLALGGPPTRRFLPLWLFLGVVTWGGYFLNLKGMGTSSQLLLVIARPLDFLSFFLSLMGNALLARKPLVYLVGAGYIAMILSCVILLVTSSRLRENRFRLGVLLFALLSLLSIAIGRFNLGVDAAAAPRYTTFSLLGMAALYAILSHLVDAKRRTGLSHWAIALVLMVIVAGIPISYHRGWMHGEIMHQKQLRMAEILMNVDKSSDKELRLIHPYPDAVRRGVSVLRELGYNVFDTSE